MRNIPEYKLTFKTFEDLMEFVLIFKSKIKDYWWEKYNNEYCLTIEPTEELAKCVKDI